MMMRSLPFLLLAGFVLVVMAGDADAEYVNPELELKFNLKEENDELSPQNKLPGEPEATKIVQAQYDDYIGFRTNREPVDVGTWTSEPVEFDLSISINSFDIWWENLEEGDDTCEWTITIMVNDADISEDTSGCQHDGDPLAKGTHDLNTNIDLVTGDTLGINLVYEGWDDIKIYYDNVTFDTGLNVKGKHLILFDNKWENTTVTIEFAEAWPTNWNTNLDAEYIIITGDANYTADNAKANVRDGNKHAFQGNNNTMEVNSTVIEWTEINGTGLKIIMDYTTFSESYGNGSSPSRPLLTIPLEWIGPELEIAHTPNEIGEGDQLTAWIDTEDNVISVTFYVCTLEEPYTCYKPETVDRNDTIDGRFQFTYVVKNNDYPGYKYELEKEDGSTEKIPENEYSAYEGMKIAKMGDSYYFEVNVATEEEEKCVDGDTKIAEDGCNQCICSNEEWACTEVDCNPDDNNDDDSDAISVPSISLIPALITIGVITIFRRK
jgi:hypothetical protein